MFIKEDDLKLNAWQFGQRKYLDWPTKLRLSRTRIREWYENWDGQVYVSYCSVYGDIRKREDGSYYLTGEQRTGCMFCAFGVHLEAEPNRFQRMAAAHPRQHQFCMKSVFQGGIGMAQVLDYMGIPWK